MKYTFLSIYFMVFLLFELVIPSFFFFCTINTLGFDLFRKSFLEVREALLLKLSDSCFLMELGPFFSFWRFRLKEI